MVVVTFAKTQIGVGILINTGMEYGINLDITGVFLPTQHNITAHQKQAVDLNTLKEVKKIHKINKTFWYRYGRCVSVNRPLNTTPNQKIAFHSIFNFSPNSNTTHSTQPHQNNVTSFIKCYEVNITKNNKQYAIFMNQEYTNILSFIIQNNIDTPLYIRNAFQTSLNPQQIRLSAGAIQIMSEENAGGCSELSEGFSFEILKQCFNAKLLKTEMAITYWWPHWKKTDYSMKINNIIIGVSVTRAMKYNGLFNKQDAVKLFTKKLNGINESTQGVIECDEWQRQILHIWCSDEYIETILHNTFLQLLFINPELVKNTIVLISVASQDMWWIFYQDKYFKKQNGNKKKRKKIKNKKVLKKNMVLTAVT